MRSTCRLFQITYEGDFRSLCTVTFWQKVDFLISKVHYNSWLYCIRKVSPQVLPWVFPQGNPNFLQPSSSCHFLQYFKSRLFLLLFFEICCFLKNILKYVVFWNWLFFKFVYFLNFLLWNAFFSKMCCFWNLLFDEICCFSYMLFFKICCCLGPLSTQQEGLTYNY